jgi:hypothetical protein
VFESPIELSGETHFPSYAVKEHRVVSPYDENLLTCTATLIKVKGQHYELVTEEYFGTLLYRNVTFDVKITPSGVVSFSWPETWLEFDGTELAPNTMNLLEQFNFHTGCVASGPDINKGTWSYKGYFDGTTFYAKTHFMGKQVIPGFIDYYAGPPLIDGPIRFEFSFELEVVE